MPIGIMINALSVLLGGIFGALGGKKMSANFKDGLNMAFGVCSMTMGIYAIAPMKNMAAVIFAIIIGTGLGLLIHLGDWINRGAAQMQKFISRFINAPTGLDRQTFDATLVTVIVLFCASGTGIYGSLTEGMNGDATILISKSILDFFTAAIFAVNLGFVVSLIAIPQFVIFIALFFAAHLIYPLTTTSMIFDFKAAGGVLMLATGFRMVQLKMFPTADMIPAMIVIMPLSWLWTTIILPML
ncbi:DUF554 domain-containing protein [Latilactobacillus sakei]|uniref:DUF554 domain-containing protein n=1 Tax=Latilactobacillus sakei TaxID=1599 RepID=UPI00033C7282|nr:DUF554 domain-containing protein [Latilactobacillus sakei]EOR85218.1 putative inner membrane protein [Latilactobacillus sakei subsp. sakei LS25]PKX63522.1 DUF554 domain-containing protein [Latilactobacillus sakei]PKX67407.1 DUF554 domain-containing protein [Latilactobacillus sakei]UNC20331.1 DUF554 domain-containing protein [Latilactobacillus sakei]